MVISSVWSGRNGKAHGTTVRVQDDSYDPSGRKRGSQHDATGSKNADNSLRRNSAN